MSGMSVGSTTVSSTLAHVDLAPGPAIDPTKLSVGELMAWVSIQLDATDKDLRMQMTKMGTVKDQQANLSKLIETLRAAHGAPGDKATLSPDPRTLDAYKGLSKEGKDAIDKLCAAAGAKPDRALSPGEMTAVPEPSPFFPFTPITKFYSPEDLVAKGDAYVGKDGVTYAKGTPPGAVDKGTVADAMEAMDKELSANQSSSEMDMIKLQSAISARGQMIQLVSNMIHQMDETSKSIVGNVR
jgi:hypothetical protein